MTACAVVVELLPMQNPKSFSLPTRHPSSEVLSAEQAVGTRVHGYDLGVCRNSCCNVIVWLIRCQSRSAVAAADVHNASPDLNVGDSESDVVKWCCCQPVCDAFPLLFTTPHQQTSWRATHTSHNALGCSAVNKQHVSVQNTHSKHEDKLFLHYQLHSIFWLINCAFFFTMFYASIIWSCGGLCFIYGNIIFSVRIGVCVREIPLKCYWVVILCWSLSEENPNTYCTFFLVGNKPGSLCSSGLSDGVLMET